MNSDRWLAGLLAIREQLGPLAVVALRVTAIAVVAWLLIAMLQRSIKTFRERIAARMDDPEAIKRAATLGRAFRYLVGVVISLVAGMLILGELGVSIAPILGAAGVVGIAIGFGAQSLVKDYFTGFFILLENQIRQGDVVQLGAHSGLVEEITLRYVQLRDYDGHVHVVPNGQITTVVNMSRGYANAVIDIGVAYRENIDRVIEVMRSTGSELREDAEFGTRILADLEIAGVERLDNSAVVVRARVRCAPLEQWAVRREYLRRIKAAFDAAGIEIPFPQVTVHSAQTNDAAIAVAATTEDGRAAGGANQR